MGANTSNSVGSMPNASGKMSSSYYPQPNQQWYPPLPQTYQHPSSIPQSQPSYTPQANNNIFSSIFANTPPQVQNAVNQAAQIAPQAIQQAAPSMQAAFQGFNNQMAGKPDDYVAPQQPNPAMQAAFQGFVNQMAGKPDDYAPPQQASPISQAPLQAQNNQPNGSAYTSSSTQPTAGMISAIQGFNNQMAGKADDYVTPQPNPAVNSAPVQSASYAQQSQAPSLNQNLAAPSAQPNAISNPNENMQNAFQAFQQQSSYPQNQQTQSPQAASTPSPQPYVNNNGGQSSSFAPRGRAENLFASGGSVNSNSVKQGLRSARDPKAISKAIMTAKSVARLIDPHFGRVPMPNLGVSDAEKPFPEHSPAIHEAYGEPMPEHFAAGGDVDGRNLNDFGLYSHAAEQAGTLARQDTPENYREMLLKRGVKPSELFWSGYDEAFKGKPSVTRDEIAHHFRTNMPDLYETYLEGKESEEMEKLRARQAEEQRENSLNDTLAFLNGRPHEGESPEEMRHRHDRERRALKKSPYHEDYTLPGGENYREILLQNNAFGGFPGVHGHFGGAPDILASLRMKDREDHEGDHVLHLEELQSDWAQQGRKKGFKDDAAAKHQAAREEYNNFVDRLSEMEAERRINALKEAQPNLDFENNDQSLRMMIDDNVRRHPHTIARNLGLSDEYNRLRDAYNEAQDNDQYRTLPKKAAYVEKTDDWVDLGLKRALLEAVNGGYNKFAWSPGDVHADRYDLSRHIGQIRHEKNPDGTYNLDVADKKGNRVFEQDDMHPEELENTVGKEMAEKILSGHGERDEDPGYRDWRTLSGLDLKVGGEGMRKFYDEILPKRLLKLARQHDPEVQLTHSVIVHPDPEKVREAEEEDDDWGLSREMRDMDHVSTRLPSLHITPRMRESILKKGFPAYASGGEVEESIGADLMRRDPMLAENPPEMEKSFASAPAKPLSEMSAKYLRKGEMEDWYEKHPEKLVKEGAILFPALGDLTAADRKLLEIGGKKLTKPVDLTGGGEYQRSPKRGAWASRALTAAMNAKKMAAQNPEGRPAYMVHTTMGLPSGDSSHMMAQSLLRLIPAMEISSKAAKAFDAVMRKDDPQWPGILNTEAAEKHLLRKDSKGGKDYTGTRVSNFLKTFDKADWRNWGFPGLGELRFATAEKRLLSAPQLSAGFSLARVRPEKGIYEEEEPHETYSGAFHKDEEQGYGGGFKHIVPATAMFSDWAKRQPKTFTKKSTGEKIPITKTMLQQALMTQHPAQIANQEWLDTVMPEYEKKKKWGYKEGGTVKRAVSIAKSLKKK